jgi:two-component system cell cycle sensor histidine kinase/response regulator CckA
MIQAEEDKSSSVHECLALLANVGQMSEAMGLLIGAIAHDFRNHLTVIQCWSDVLMRPGSLLRDKAVGHVQRIRSAAVRAIQLSEQLLAFSNPQHANPRVVNLNKMIGAVVKLAEGAVDENIHLRFVDCSDLGDLNLDFGRFQQALLCVILNARDAMPKGGEIAVKCSIVDLDDVAAANLVGALPGENVQVKVTSTESGPGKETTIEMYLPRVVEGVAQKVNP